MVLYHYTTGEGLRAIMATGQLLPSTAAQNPRDVRYGNGQYLSDIVPGTRTAAQLSRHFLNLPFHGDRFTHYLAIDVRGLEVIWGRPGVCVIPNDLPLEIWDRVVESGVHVTDTRTGG